MIVQFGSLYMLIKILDAKELRLRFEIRDSRIFFSGKILDSAAVRRRRVLRKLHFNNRYRLPVQVLYLRAKINAH